MKKIAPLLLFCLILAAGVLLDIAPIQVPDGIDKVYHFVGFALITIFAITTFVSFLGEKVLNQFLLFLLAFGGIFAGLSEYLQSFTTARSCSVNDWITNLLGISFVVIITFLINAKKNKTAEVSDGRFEFRDLPQLF